MMTEGKSLSTIERHFWLSEGKQTSLSISDTRSGLQKDHTLGIRVKT